MAIFCDVLRVIGDDKLMITHLPVDCKGDHNQKQANQDITAQDEGLVFDNIHMPMGCLILSLFSPRSLGIRVRTFFKYKVAILMPATLGN